MSPAHRIASSVVIGSGGSGVRTAIELAEREIDVLVLTNRSESDPHTALATMDPRDS